MHTFQIYAAPIEDNTVVDTRKQAMHIKPLTTPTPVGHHTSTSHAGNACNACATHRKHPGNTRTSQDYVEGSFMSMRCVGVTSLLAHSGREQACSFCSTAVTVCDACLAWIQTTAARVLKKGARHFSTRKCPWPHPLRQPYPLDAPTSLLAKEEEHFVRSYVNNRGRAAHETVKYRPPIFPDRTLRATES